MPVKWFALSVLTVLLAFAVDAQARTRNASGDPGPSAAYARGDQDFSAAKKYAKKQTDTYQRTKKYR